MQRKRRRSWNLLSGGGAPHSPEGASEDTLLSTDGEGDAAPVVAGNASYTVRERPASFRIRVVGCPLVRVRRRATWFEVTSPSGQRRVGFTERQLTNAIVDAAMVDWRLPSGRRLTRDDAPLRRWVLLAVRRLLADPVHVQCGRLLTAVDPNVVAVHHALSSVSSTPSSLAMCPDLYRESHLVRDIINYRAAAIVVDNAEQLVWRVRRERVDASPELAELKTRASAYGAQVSVYVPPVDSLPDGPGGAAHVLTPLRDWRGLLSPSGHSYRSLDRTLMNLPRGVPGRLVCLLAHITLRRPLTDRLELLLVTLCLDRFGHRDGDVPHQRVFVTARAPQIREAVRRVAAHTRNDLRVMRMGDLRFFIGFLVDFPDHHAGTIVGLADKAICWHRHQLAEKRAEILGRYGAETAAGLPPIRLPTDPSVRYLATVADIVTEGEQMEHCIAQSVPAAVGGRCYLFHVEYGGDAATVMVTPEYVEARGPRNRKNAATRWGEERLTTWARGLRRVQEQAG